MFTFKQRPRRLILCLVSLMIPLVGPGVWGNSSVDALSVNCQAFPSIPVALTDSGLPSYHVWGELCATPHELQQPDGTATVQVLLSGITYGHVYWDLSTNPIDGISYTYARNEAAAGYPTFVLDRIGIGLSDHPSSSLVDVNTNATVVHQVVQGLRNGSITGIRFGKVIEMSHSFGSAVAEVEASTYHDVDGLILTGALHHVNPALTTLLSAALHPAGADPRFASQPWASDAGYLTTNPPPNGDVAHGFRAQLFYNTEIADLNVIATDERTKETLTANELSSSASIQPTISLQIHVPVELIYGTKDFLYCDPTFDCSNIITVQQEEAPFYSQESCLQIAPIPLSGHDVSLHPNNYLQVSAALAWSDQFVGRSTFSQPPGCL